MNQWAKCVVLGTVWIAGLPAPKAESADSVLTLQHVLALVLERSPELAAFPMGLRAAEAQVVQAGLGYNPEIGASFEDFAGSDAFQGTRQMQTTVQLGQVIELGGKRSARKALATSELEKVGSEYELKRVDVLADATERYIDVVTAQHLLELARETMASAEELTRNAADRLKAGKGSPLEEKRAAVAVMQRRIGAETAIRDLVAARRRLAASWASDTLEFDRAGGDLFGLTAPIPPLEDLVASLNSSPELLRWTSEERLREAELRLAESGATPDLRAAGGLRLHNSSDDYSIVAELSFPLPLFNRNQGARRAAEAQVEEIRVARTAAEVRLRALLFEFYQALASASIAVTSSRDELVPVAEDLLEMARTGYQAGRYSFLEVAEAHRTVFELKAQLITSARIYHTLVADIERLTGQTLQP